MRAYAVGLFVAGVAAVLLGASAPPRGGAATACAQGTTLSIVAHTDDDLLFQSPNLLQDVRNGLCVRTVVVTADDSNQGMPRTLVSEAGNRAGYAAMVGATNSWTLADAGIPGHPIPMYTLNGHPEIAVMFMRLPQAQIDGTGESLHNGETPTKLWNGTIGQTTAIDGSSTYTRAGLISTLTAFMTAFQPQTIRVQDYVDPPNAPDFDHADHRAVAYFAEAASSGYPAAHTLIGYMDYPVKYKPQNVFGSDLTAKENAYFAYANVTGLCNSVTSCAANDTLAWLERQYVVGTEVTAGGGGSVPVNVGLPVVSGLVVGQGQVLSASSGSWSGSPSSFAYQWQRCDGSGSLCQSVSGQTSSSYRLGSADVGATVRVVVTAANGVGSAAVSSAVSGVVLADRALSRPVSASASEASSLGPQFANDGSSSTRWSSAFVDGQWWQVDLGSVRQVSAVALNWETAYASSYRLQVSSDGSSFTDAASVGLGQAGWRLTSFAAVSGRYLRVLCVTRATQWGCSFWDAQVFGPGT